MNRSCATDVRLRFTSRQVFQNGRELALHDVYWARQNTSINRMSQPHVRRLKRQLGEVHVGAYQVMLMLCVFIESPFVSLSMFRPKKLRCLRKLGMYFGFKDFRLTTSAGDAGIPMVTLPHNSDIHTSLEPVLAGPSYLMSEVRPRGALILQLELWPRVDFKYFYLVCSIYKYLY